jgi:hypothetical protein
MRGRGQGQSIWGTGRGSVVHPKVEDASLRRAGGWMCVAVAALFALCPAAAVAHLLAGR